MKPLNSLRFVVIAKFLIIIFFLSSLILIIVPLGLQRFYIEESYKTMEQIQEGSFSYDATEIIHPTRVNHLYIVEQAPGQPLAVTDPDVSSEFASAILENLANQTQVQVRYAYEEDDDTIFYIIKIIDAKQYMVSFVYLTYVDHYVSILYMQLLTVVLIIVVVTLIIALFFANSIAEPLVTISRKIKNISDNNWDEEIPVTRDDEIGQIQASLEDMRINLKARSKIQQEMFQNISHDLKTPIMIIEGYSQAIIDGYIAEEHLDETVHSILDEAKRLDNKVKSLLYINKLDQMYTGRNSFKEVDMNELIKAVISPFKARFQHLVFKVDINDQVPLTGEFDEWRIALENIVDNMTRFASSTIEVSYDGSKLSIFNDGEPMDEDTLNTLFEAYVVGKKPNFGLGMTITKKIVTMFGYHITVKNVETGVLFEIFKR